MAKKVLIIDDDADFREVIVNLVEAKGYAALTAQDGREGFEKAKKEQPNIILLDVMMAHKTEGFDAARDLHTDAATKAIPVVMVTGIRKDMNLPFGFEPNEDWLPTKAVLEKPVKPDVLLKTIEENIS